MKFLLYTYCMNNTNKSFVSLTNSAPAHRGNRIAISKDLIVTVHNAIATRDDGLTELVTYVFCPPHGTWEVSETYEQVVEQLNS
jgi:hypothetical protein